MNQLGLSTQNSTFRSMKASHTLPIPSFPRWAVVPAQSTKRFTPFEIAKSTNPIIGIQGCATCGSIIYTTVMGCLEKMAGHVVESDQSNLIKGPSEVAEVGGLRDVRRNGISLWWRSSATRVEVLPVPPVRRTTMVKNVVANSPRSLQWLWTLYVSIASLRANFVQCVSVIQLYPGDKGYYLRYCPGNRWCKISSTMNYTRSSAFKQNSKSAESITSTKIRV